MSDLQAISRKLDLAIRRLQTFDREAHQEAYRDIVEAAFLLSLAVHGDPVEASIRKAVEP